MNYSDLRAAACRYLGCRDAPAPQMLSMVDDGIAEADRLSRFRAVARTYTVPPAFLGREPYASFLAGCSGCALVAMTLGAEGERRVRALMTLDPARAVVLDACLSALIEREGDAWEERQFGSERTYRFCPGYGGSDVMDNRLIFEAVRPERIGMQLLPSGMMAPQKSMAGIVGLGRRGQKTCSGCMAAEGCRFRREGRICWENNC